MTTFRNVRADDIDNIKSLAIRNDMFGPDEVGWVDEMVQGVLGGAMEGHRWLILAAEDGAPIGAAYFAPEPFSDRLWNLYFLAVAPESHGVGAGRQLLGAVEDELRQRGLSAARVLLIETSSTDAYARTRSFYTQQGYTEEARIREYYGPGDDKVVFWKALHPSVG